MYKIIQNTCVHLYRNVKNYYFYYKNLLLRNSITYSLNSFISNIVTSYNSYIFKYTYIKFLIYLWINAYIICRVLRLIFVAYFTFSNQHAVSICIFSAGSFLLLMRPTEKENLPREVAYTHLVFLCKWIHGKRYVKWGEQGFRRISSALEVYKPSQGGGNVWSIRISYSFVRFYFQLAPSQRIQDSNRSVVYSWKIHSAVPRCDPRARARMLIHFSYYIIEPHCKPLFAKPMRRKGDCVCIITELVGCTRDVCIPRFGALLIL